jgi:hypothetical protein
MAPPRRKQLTSREYRDYKIRLPEDVAARVEHDAKAEDRPMNRIIINDLAAIPYLKTVAKFDERVRDMETLLAKYGGRITDLDIGEQLLDAVDAVLKAEGGTVQAGIEKLRVVRTAMLVHERTAEKRKK